MLSPTTSKLILRATCTAIGIGFPVYATFKALEKKDQAEQEEWLVYWAVYGCFNVAEAFSDKLLSWFPYYYHAKLVFLIWLQLPFNYGSRHLFAFYLRPLLIKYQNRLDRIVDGTRKDINNFVSSHRKEIHYIANSAQKVAFSAFRAAEELVRTPRRHQSPSVNSENVNSTAD
ncbi:hypothetical protein O6H91_03G133000 [Diphasiastrum complanatum]|uniref:Uncharacterized protein n=1 Tax=Diphasiastrum complanatum TaxID=34168 RepID=A0ACC2ECB2_DIPCM|nr:hypothetical protein O6H91_Y262400 [Diphasiastrum complanatum]KAJ7563987.1 hypothetical protein O6H91_03G133000 [Diphasiastrum complanatum]